MTAVIYCRVSTRDQVENLSLATQEENCRSFCDREGIDVDRVFVEEGESAKTADRTQLQEMLRYCHRNRKQIDTVVVYAVNRFARNSADHHAIRAVLAKMGIGLRSVTEPINNTPTGKLTEGIFAAFAEYDNSVRAERTVVGMQAALERGRWTHQPPIGYRKPPKTTDGPSLEQDRLRAPLVARAFALMATGNYTREEVRAEVSALGLRTRRDKPVSKQSFFRLLRNPIYRGRVVVPSWKVNFPGDFEAIVEEEVFAAVQAILAGRSASKEDRRYDNPMFPLRRFIWCGKCGTPLTGSSSKGRSRRYSNYRCRNASCKVNVRKESLEQAFSAALRRLSVRPEVMRLFEEIVRDAWKGRHAAILDRQEALRRRLRELQERENRLVDAHLYQGKIDEETFRRQSQRLRDDMDQIRSQIREARLESMNIDETLRFAKSLLGDPAAFWERAAPEHRPRLQKAIYPNGLGFDGKLVGTAETSLAFSYLKDIQARKEDMASPTGLEPVLPA